MPVSKRILGMAATPKFLIVASQDELQILDVETFQQIDSLNPQGETDLLAVSADGSYLAAFNSNGQILIWKQVNDKFASPQIINRAGVSSLAFSPANNLLAAGATDHIFLFELSSLEEVVRIPVTGTVNSLAFSPDSSTLMSAALKFVQFWDVTRLLDARVTRATILDEACKHLPENLSEDQWNQLFENEKFKALCPNLPTP
jgi:WD40 repeat protein